MIDDKPKNMTTLEWRQARIEQYALDMFKIMLEARPGLMVVPDAKAIMLDCHTAAIELVGTPEDSIRAARPDVLLSQDPLEISIDKTDDKNEDIRG